jgi:sugar O-acyltransferase (sialic acid O-acetyltransferase NeuD family)
MSKSLCIFGSGGFAKEVYLLARDCGREVKYFVDLHESKLFDLPVVTEKDFNPKEHLAIVAVGSPHVRQKITEKLIKLGAEFDTLIHPSARVLGLADLWLHPNVVDKYVKLGRGTVICAGCILTGDIELGDFAQLNLGTTIGHDVKTGRYFTTAPMVAISGNVHAGDRVYFGTKACSIEGINIVDDVTVGAAACVTKDILLSGTYVGIPAKRLEK